MSWDIGRAKSWVEQRAHPTVQFTCLFEHFEALWLRMRHILFQQDSYLFLLFLEFSQLLFKSPELGPLNHNFEWWCIQMFSCSWLGPETVADCLHLSPIHPSCLAACVYPVYLVLGHEICYVPDSQTIERMDLRIIVKRAYEKFAVGWVLRNKHLIDRIQLDSLVIPRITCEVKDDGEAIWCPTMKTHLTDGNWYKDLYFNCIVRQNLC